MSPVQALLHGLDLDTAMDIRIHSTADRDRLSQGVQVRYTPAMQLLFEKPGAGRNAAQTDTVAEVAAGMANGVVAASIDNSSVVSHADLVIAKDFLSLDNEGASANQGH